MGLIVVSNKGYPILVIPKKNKIKSALAKLQANLHPKVEYERIQWEGQKLGATQRRIKIRIERSSSLS